MQCIDEAVRVFRVGNKPDTRVLRIHLPSASCFGWVNPVSPSDPDNPLTETRDNGFFAEDVDGIAFGAVRVFQETIVFDGRFCARLSAISDIERSKVADTPTDGQSVDQITIRFRQSDAGDLVIQYRFIPMSKEKLEMEREFIAVFDPDWAEGVRYLDPGTRFTDLMTCPYPSRPLL